jgi:hypothetical protein
LLLIYTYPLLAQRKNSDYKYHIYKTPSTINIDGNLDEDIWLKAQIAGDFWMMLPMDTSKAKLKTEVMMSYDDKNIYIAALNYFPHEVYNVESLRRDWNFGKNDNFLIVFDTYNDQTNGFAFGTNAAGAQWDGQQYDGGPINLSWDNKWISSVKKFEDHWILEAAIPFKSLRYNTTLSSWGVNFSRNDLYSTEKSVWAPVPRQFPSVSSAYMGELVWDAIPPRASSNVSVIPYVKADALKDVSKNTDTNIHAEFGADAKIALTSSLNLDLTFNPDFSQVEVDKQQINLDRFELFFPERRQFFLENEDLFNNLGMERIRPFFSRRIGLNAPISYGARLSGKLNKNLRVGAMHIKTSDEENTANNNQNFSVLTLQQKVFSRSNITGVIINRDKANNHDYNRNIGLEYNLASKNNELTGKFIYYYSLTEEKNQHNDMYAASIAFNNRYWSINTKVENVGKGFSADVGFIQRVNFKRISEDISYTFYPKGTFLLSHGPGAFAFGYFNESNIGIENTVGVNYDFELRSRAVIWVYAAKDYIDLQTSFDPTNLTGIKLPIGSRHHWSSTGFNFNSKPQSTFTYGISTRYGGYYADGTRIRVAPNIGYRVQPYIALNIDAEYNHIDLPEEQNLKDAKFWLISPRLDLTLTNNFYITAFYQYNEQIKNSNINARLQWRFQPASDIFLVFTDNYSILDNSLRNRAVVFKLTYWWNV